jgi:hypothetical protein
MAGEPFLKLRQEVDEGLLGGRLAGHPEFWVLVFGTVPDVGAHDWES